MFGFRWVSTIEPRAKASILWASLALLIGFASATTVLAADQTPAKRMALLIANGDYQTAGGTIASATKDAHLLLDELTRNRFDVDLRENASKNTMQAVLEAFKAKISPGSVALFYFAGFGVQVGRQSYLLPTDAQITTEGDVKREGVSLEAVLNDMDRRGAQVKIVIIDASRRNPFERRFRGVFSGLASVDAPEGTLSLYAAAPGRLSSDDARDTSLLMSELTKELRSPGNTAEEVFTHARMGVSRASNGEQIPWVASSLVDDFSFGVADRPNAAPSQGRPAPVVASAPAPTPDVPSQPPPPVQSLPPAEPADQESAARPASGLPSAPVPAPARVTPPPPAPPNLVEAANPPPSSPPIDAEDDDPKPGPKKNEEIGLVKDCEQCPELKIILAGTFDMGSGSTPFDRPVHKVTIAKPFAMGLNEVTFDDWQACVAGGGCSFRPDDQGWGAGNHPVVNISWSDAKQYAAWLSKVTGHVYRLPSEAEWEYAARGGSTTAFPWGATVGTKFANCRDCQASPNGRTMLVRSFPPNGFGLFDMAGNAAEWVEDCWNESYRGAPKDGSAWTAGGCEQRVLRGGSFDSLSAYVKTTARFRYDADVRYYGNGFRIVRNLP